MPELRPRLGCDRENARFRNLGGQMFTPSRFVDAEAAKLDAAIAANLKELGYGE